MVEFWNRWLVVVSAGFVVVGLLFAVASGTVLFAPLMDPIHTHFWGGPELSEGASSYSRFLFGIIGGLTSGFGVLAFQVARHAVARRELWAWRGLAVGLALWYLVDSAVSAYFGALINVLGNTGFALAMAVPLIGLRRHMGANANEGVETGSGAARTASV